MTPERWQQVKEILDGALTLASEQRSAFLDQACSADQSLRQDVESLLASADEAHSGFLQSSAVRLIISSDDTLDSSPGSGPPATPTGTKVIGPYRLVRKLGEGGMGQVWLAEQTEPLRRQVALKLIRAGMYDDSVLQRFQSERQSLAIMEHPSIAKVFDAGATSDGQPYFVMEYVPGLPITDYCDQQRLKIRERLELFVKVCEGVQHAHQKAIMHRDLKPANILVVEVDGKPVPRIIDFGLAKAVTRQINGQTLFTQVGSWLGTPGYMSPEQADPGVVDVDTRTDVYSLGAVLYVLLTGFLPFESKDWRRHQRIEEFLRHLHNEDPPRPSAKLRTENDSARTIAEARGSEPKHLVSLLCGDLDWITMKALEKDRVRRYGTPSELAADIGRYLRHEPVVARPASTRYRLQKYVHRHRIGVSAAAGVVAVLIAFGVMQTVQLRRIIRERDRANRITDFMMNMFKVSDPSEARGNSITAREILDRASKDIDQGLAKDPEVRAQMMNVMGNVYDHLGLYPPAESLFTQALAIRRRVLGPKHQATLESMHDLAVTLQDDGHYADAEKLQRETLDTQRHVLGPKHRQTLASMIELGATLGYEGHYADAEKLFREALELQRRSLGPEHPDTLRSMQALATALDLQGRHADAEQLYRKTLDIRRRILGPDHPDTLTATMNLTGLVLDEGRYPEAEKLAREALDTARRILGPEHPQTLAAVSLLADAVLSEGHYAEAERLQREALETARKVLGPENPQTLMWMNNVGSVLQGEGRYSEAEKLHRETLEVRRRILGPDHPDTLVSAYNVAQTLLDEGRYPEAEKVGRETLDTARRVLGPEHHWTLSLMNTLALCLLQEGRYPEAEKLQGEALDTARRVLGPEHPDTADSTYNMARIAARTDRHDQALSLLREAVDHGLEPAKDLDVGKDPYLKSLHGEPQFDALVVYARQRAATQQK